MNRPEPPPRNYFTVPPSGSAGPSQPPVYHDRLAPEIWMTGALEIEIEALSPVHVGCGSFELSDGGICKEPLRRRGVLVIPGSSLKGACRQIFEVLTASGSPFDERWRDGAPPSAAASLFGTLGMQGRVSFDDAMPVHRPEPPGVEPEPIRLSVAYPPQKAAGRRFYGPLPAGARQPPSVPALAIPRGAVLVTTLRLRNVSHSELGAILTSLGVGQFTLRLGGGKYDDFGWVRFRPAAFRLRPPGLAGGGTWERSPDAVAAFVDGCLHRVSLPPTAGGALAILTERLQNPVPCLPPEAGR